MIAMDLPQLVQKLGEVEGRFKVVSEAIKYETRKHGIPLTTNVTSCYKENCTSCKLGFNHGIYFVTRIGNRKVRLKQSEIVPCLSRFVGKQLLDEFVNLRGERHNLIQRINNLVRWHEHEKRNLTTYLRYASPQQFYAMYATPSFQQAHTQQDAAQRLAERGKKLLFELLGEGMERFAEWLDKSSTARKSPSEKEP